MGLFLCGGCQRHVRSDERVCPFCGGDDLRSTAKPAGRLSRGAMIGAAAVALACSSSTTPPDDGGTQQDSGYDAMQAAYGGPPDASSLDATPPSDAAPDSPVAAYGGPPQDAGTG